MISLLAAFALAKPFQAGQTTAKPTPAAPAKTVPSAKTPMGKTPVLPAPDKVVITVNGHPILAKEVEAYLWDWSAEQVGQTLTIVEIIKEEAAKKGVTVTDAEIQSKIDAQLQQFLASAPKGTPPDQLLKARGYIKSRVEMTTRAQLLLEKIAAADFKASDFVRVATIIVRPKSEQATDVQAALTKANEAYAALQKGDAWEKVLPAYATEPQSVPNQGELGWIKEDAFPVPTRTELDTLKPGGYTKPVQTPGGIQIFKLETKGKDASAGELSDAKARFVASAGRDLAGRLQRDAKITTSY